MKHYPVAHNGRLSDSLSLEGGELNHPVLEVVESVNGKSERMTGNKLLVCLARLRH